MKNLNLLFNKTYYEALGGNNFAAQVQKCNDDICGAKFRKDDYREIKGLYNHTFLMTVCYPGLMTGLGNQHSAGIADEEIAAGFSFDYVTGQPYIPGSTVKGALRRHFKDHPGIIQALCGRDEVWVKGLEQDIFENNDVFFDAVLHESNAGKTVMDLEFITPHPSPTENPVPIKLIKVRPNVCFEFRFRLHDGQWLTAKEKEELFQKLLACFGIGAKTNVGFGILREGIPEPEEQKPERIDVPRKDNRQKPDRPQQNKGADSRVCPHCQTRNFRFNKNDGKERWNWPKNICWSCKGSLDE